MRPAIEKGEYYSNIAYEHYLWNVADSIPLVKAPETLNWKPEHRITDHFDGTLTLIAKILVILPFLNLAGLALRQWLPPTPPMSRDEAHAQAEQAE